MSNQDTTTINEQTIILTVHEYNKHIGHVKEKTLYFHKYRNKKCKEQYKFKNELVLTKEQRTLLTAFINSLNNDK